MQTVTRIDPDTFTQQLYALMPSVNPAVAQMELYEFQYALDNLTPLNGDWASIALDSMDTIEKMVNSRAFYDSIQIKQRKGVRVLFDDKIVRLTQMLLVGLTSGSYPPDWVNTHFYFDVRGFFFLHRTNYFNEQILAHFDGKPFQTFEAKQKQLSLHQDIGYKDFQWANAEVDQLFIDCILRIVITRGTPILIAIAGPTAAGKTEIVDRLRAAFAENALQVTSIELDNFLTDRDYREEKGIFTQGKQAFHFEHFKQSLADISQGKVISIPRYDFVDATSSHDLQGNLKPDGVPIVIEPADIIFIEGNFPFLEPEVAELICIKVVYLTDDEIRLKRKWKRDIDYRKKYETTYFRNRFFKDQFIMAEIAYRPQMAICDFLVETTAAALWVTPEMAQILTGLQKIS